MTWEWLENTMRTITYLKGIIRGLESGYIIVDNVDRVKEKINNLISKVVKFERLYASDEDLILGYFVVIKGGNVIEVKALTAYGEEEPKVEMIDIEEWLEGYKQVVGDEHEASG
jgi:hypothetical protein